MLTMYDIRLRPPDILTDGRWPWLADAARPYRQWRRQAAIRGLLLALVVM